MAFGEFPSAWGRDLIRHITAGFYTRRFLGIGQQLEILGQRGELTEINATHAILRSDDHGISIANAAFLESIARSWPAEE